MPWLADTGCAWRLLCQPSPPVNSATHQLFVESSRVLKRREPHRWVAELTSQVTWKPTEIRKNTPHNNHERPSFHPPRAVPTPSKAMPVRVMGSQCHTASH